MSVNDQYMILQNELTRYLQAPPSWCGYGPVKGGKPVSMIITCTNNINVIWSDRWDILSEDWLNIFWSGGQGLIRNFVIRRKTIDKIFFLQEDEVLPQPGLEGIRAGEIAPAGWILNIFRYLPWIFFWLKFRFSYLIYSIYLLLPVYLLRYYCSFVFLSLF